MDIDYVSNAIGAWKTPTRWTPNGVPGDGDTAVINHDTTIDDAQVIGTSDVAGTLALTINAPLTIQNGGTLRLRGDAVVGNVAFTVDQGGTLIFDASLAAAPSTTNYKVTISSANAQTSAYFKTTGVAGNIASVSSDAGGGNGYFATGGFSQGGKAQLSYADFTRIGDGTNNSFTTSTELVIDHCIFDGCAGPTSGVSLPSTATFSVDRVTFKNTGTNKVFHVAGGSSFTSGTRKVTSCVFDHRPDFFQPTGFTLDDNIFYASPPSLTNGAWASYQRNLVRLTGTQQAASLADMDDCYFVGDDSHTNRHFLAPGSTAPGHDLTGLIFENASDDGQGDCILSPSVATPQAYAVSQCIVLPTSGGKQAGTLLTLFGNDNVTFSVEHCTYFATGGATATPGISLEETSTAHAGELSSYKNNIAWTTVGGGGLKLNNVGADTADIVDAADADYNCGWNLDAGSEGGGYNTPMTGTPGVHDVDGNPQFVDSTRNLAAWDDSLGGAGTNANAFAELMKLNDRTGYNSDYAIADLLAWVRAGFAPQNSALATAGSDGATIGAVDWVASGVEALPDVGALTLAGFAPVPTTSDNQTVTPTVGALTITGFAPTISLGTVLRPGVGTLTITGFAPSVFASDNQEVTPGVGIVTLAGFDPLISVGNVAAPDVGALTVTGFAPTLTQSNHQHVTPGVGALAFAGFAPTVFASDSKTVLPGVGALALTGYAPTITGIVVAADFVRLRALTVRDPRITLTLRDPRLSSFTATDSLSS